MVDQHSGVLEREGRVPRDSAGATLEIVDGRAARRRRRGTVAGPESNSRGAVRAPNGLAGCATI